MKKVNANDARVTNFEELKERNEFTIIDLNSPLVQPAGGTILHVSKSGDMMVMDRDCHSAIVGETGSKKTICENVGMLLSLASAGYSAIVTDVKDAELFRLTSAPIQKMGVKIRTLNLGNPKLSTDSWNFNLQSSRMYTEGRRGEAMNSFAETGNSLKEGVHSEKDVFWSNTVADLIAGLLAILAHENPNKPWMCTLENAFNLYVEGNTKIGNKTALQVYISQNRKNIPEIEKKCYSTLAAPSETKASIDAVFSSALAPLIYNSELNKLLERSSFTAEDLISEQTILYIILPEYATALHCVAAIIVQSIYRELIKLAENGRLKRKIDFLMEEFGNFPALSSMESMITTSRSRGIRFHLTLQSLSMLDLKYGTERAKIIKQNLSTLVYMGCSDLDTAKYISERIGEYTTHSGERRKLVTKERLLQMDKSNGEVFILLQRSPCLHGFLPVCFNYPGIQYGEIPLKERELGKTERFNFSKIIDGILKEKDDIFAQILKDAERAKKEEKKDKNDKTNKLELPVFTPPTVPDKKAEVKETMIKFIDYVGKENPDARLEALFKRNKEQDKKEEKKNEGNKEED